LFNASELDLPWTLPSKVWRHPWVAELDTSGTIARGASLSSKAVVTLPQRSMLVLRSAARRAKPVYSS
jgi:hypothetical protein